MSGFRNGRAGLPALILASLMRAQKPAQSGALQLVPPIWTVLPWKIRKAPVFGSATAATSGTRRAVPGSPVLVCQAGRVKKMLLPPPLLTQPVSLETAPLVLRWRVVPPTPTTEGSED